VPAGTGADILERQFSRRMEAVETRWTPRQESLANQLQHTNETWDDI